jgi:hypothetical protein
VKGLPDLLGRAGSRGRGALVERALMDWFTAYWIKQADTPIATYLYYLWTKGYI